MGAMDSDLIRRAADAVAERFGSLRPRVAIILGSGLGAVADAVQSAIRIPQSAIPGFPEPGAPGHKGELVGGTLEGVPVVVQSGRFHLYQGHAPEVAAPPARAFARLGATTLAVTNAAGASRPTSRPPVLLPMQDTPTLPERLAARAPGIRRLGFSSITNVAAGLSAQKLAHLEVLEAGKQVAGQLEQLIKGVLRRL